MKAKFYSAITAVAILLCWAALAVTTPAQREGHSGQKPPTQQHRDHPPPAQDKQQRQEAPHQGMRMEMMQNHLLAMAYLQNMTIFATLLRDQIQRDNAINGAFARDITAELRRSFDQVERYRQDQMDITQTAMRAQVAGIQTGAATNHSSAQANAPSEYNALREIGAERGAITEPSPAVQGAARPQSGGHTHSQADGQMSNQMASQMTEMMRKMETCLTQLSAHLIELERETGAANPNPKWTLQHTNEILRLLEDIFAMHSGRHAGK